MKRFIFIFIFCFSVWIPLVSAVVRVSDAVEVQEGVVQEAAILADREGSVFLDFLKDTRVFTYEERGAYEGTVTPPEIVNVPLLPPLPRMQEILVFSLEGSTGDPLVFADKIQFMSAKSLYRLQKQNPEDFVRTARVKVYIPLEKDIEEVSLWEFIPKQSWSSSAHTQEIDDSEKSSFLEQGKDFLQSLSRQEEEDNSAEEGESEAESETRKSSFLENENDTKEAQWIRIGGRIEETEKEENVFIAHIKNTGTYALFNERPQPTGVDPSDISNIELAEQPPYRDDFIDPNAGLNEAGLFDAESLQDYETDINFDPAVSGDEDVYTSNEVVIPPSSQSAQSANTTPMPLINNAQGNTNAIPSVQENFVPSTNEPNNQAIPGGQSSAPKAPQETVIPLYASYVVCETPPPRLDTLPGAPNWQRPSFLNPQNQTPLTQQQVDQIPENCEIRIPQNILLQYQSENAPFQTSSEQQNKSGNLSQETKGSNISGKDLQASTFGTSLPKTGQKKEIGFPFTFVFVFGLLSASVFVVIRSGRKKKKV